MADSIIMERVADAAAERFYAELVKTEDLGAFEALTSVRAKVRSLSSTISRSFGASFFVMPGEVPLQLQLVRHLDRLVQVGDEI